MRVRSVTLVLIFSCLQAKGRCKDRIPFGKYGQKLHVTTFNDFLLYVYTFVLKSNENSREQPPQLSVLLREILILAAAVHECV